MPCRKWVHSDWRCRLLRNFFTNSEIDNFRGVSSPLQQPEIGLFTSWKCKKPSYMENCTKLFTWTCHPASSTGKTLYVDSTQQILYDLKQESLTWFSTFSHVIKSVAFHIKDLRDLKYFLEIEFSRSKAGVYLLQRKYVLDIYRIWDCARPYKFPMEQYLKLTPDNGELLKDPVKYRQLVGRLISRGYSAWHSSVFDLDPKSIYTSSTKTSLGCRNSSPKVHQRITGTRIVIVIR